MAALLGDESNGRWRIAATESDARVTRRYRGDTLILETRIETSGGAAILTNFMPVRGQASDIIRIVTGDRGAVSLKSELRIRFDYGRRRPRWNCEQQSTLSRSQARTVCGSFRTRRCDWPETKAASRTSPSGPARASPSC
jgi:hypothetical protein